MVVISDTLENWFITFKYHNYHYYVNIQAEKTFSHFVTLTNKQKLKQFPWTIKESSTLKMYVIDKNIHQI